MEEEEIWKDVEGFEGVYQVSSTGKLLSLNYRGSGKKRLLKGRTMKKGYKSVRLTNGKQYVDEYFHRLVADHHNPRTETDIRLGRDTIRFKDGDPTNLRVNNLVWSTREEVAQHSINAGKYTSKKGQAMFASTGQVYEIKRHLTKGELSGTDIAALYSISPMTVSHIKHNRRRSRS